MYILVALGFVFSFVPEKSYSNIAMVKKLTAGEASGI
jgi:hypothetical protein